jgi:predicted MFS family arabinose efflux permease
MLSSPSFRIFVLTLAHFTVDFYVGLIIPLPEPFLINHLNTDLLAVMALVSTSAVIFNGIQPLAGAFLPKRAWPMIMVAAPVLAALTGLVGLTHHYAVVALLLWTAAVGIGCLHPEGAALAHGLARKRPGLVVAVFMSGGNLGFASGALVGGVWAAKWGLDGIWIVSLLGLITLVLLLLSGAYRVSAPSNASETSTPKREGLPFVLVMILAVSVTATVTLLSRLLPVYLYRCFGREAVAYAGAAFFLTGLAGVAGSYVWGFFSGRFGCGRIIILAEILGLPFLYLMIHPGSMSLVPFFGLGLGLTLTGVFPLAVVMAHQARGLNRRARLGLAIGGAWGLGELLALGGAKYVDQFPPGAPEPVAQVLGLCYVLVGLTVVISIVVARMERNQTI